MTRIRVGMAIFKWHVDVKSGEVFFIFREHVVRATAY